MNRGDYTLVILKPDALETGVVGKALAQLEDAGLRLECGRTASVEYGWPWGHINTVNLRSHYAEHAGTDYYDDLIASMQAGPFMLAIVVGPDAVRVARREAGHYAHPDPGTIRAQYSTGRYRNVIHTASDPDAADREIDLWYGSFTLDRLRGES